MVNMTNGGRNNKGVDLAIPSYAVQCPTMCTPPDILARGPFTTDQITIRWDPQPRPISSSAGDYIEERWDRYCAEARHNNRMLYNGLVAELRAAEVRNNRLELSLSPTDYKTFVVTCMRDRTWFLANAPEAISPALGNSILLTMNHQAILGVRSQAVAAYPGRVHLFGGVLDAPEVAGQSLDTNFLLRHLYQELHEELQITPEHFLAPPRVLALLRDDFLGQPELAWHAPLKGPIDTLLGSLNTEEHDQYALLDLAQPVAAYSVGLTPVARKMLELQRSIGQA